MMATVGALLMALAAFLVAIEDDKPVTVTIKLPAAVHRDLRAYAEVLKREGGHTIDLNSLVAPMLARFMATDEREGKFRTTIGSVVQQI